MTASTEHPPSLLPPGEPHQGPPHDPPPLSAGGIRLFELLITSSGLILAGLYVAGRVYLAASLAPLHLQVSDLDPPVDEIMFQTWLIALPVVWAVLACLTYASLWQTLAAREQHLQALLTRNEAVAIRLGSLGRDKEELSRDLEALLRDAESLAQHRHDDNEVPPELESRAEELKSRTDNLEKATDALDETQRQIGLELDQIHDDAAPISIVRHIPTGTPMAIIACGLYVAFAALALWLEGRPAGFFMLARPLLFSAVTMLIFVAFTKTLAARSLLWKSTIGVVILFIVLLPYPATAGLLEGLENRHSSSIHDSAFTQVTLRSDRQLRSDWTESGNLYHTPPLGLIAETSTRLFLWDPLDPGKTLQIPAAAITSLERE